MIFPLNVNKIEQLEFDPQKKVNGYIWFNKVEKVYKTWIDGILNVFLTDHNDSLSEFVENALGQHQFSISFIEAYSVIIRHNKNTNFFNYNVYDTEENCGLSCSLEIINANEVSVSFTDPVTGYIFMYFE